MEILLFFGVLLIAGLLADVRGRLKTAEERLAQLEQQARSGAMSAAAGAAPAAAQAPAMPPPAADPPSPAQTAIAPQPEEPAPEETPSTPAMALAAGDDDSRNGPWMSAEKDEDSDTPGLAGNAEPVPPVPPVERVTSSRPDKPAFSFSFEDFFGRKLPIWAGGITLAVAGVLIVNYALAQGLLTPWVQVAAALMFGLGLLAGAEAAQQNRLKVGDPRVAQALAGAGLATLYAAAFVAGNVHGLIGPLATFAAMAAVTAAALALASRFGAPTALLALAGGFATPALIDSADPNIPMLAAYLALTIAGLTAVGRGQRWAWLGIATLVGGGLWTLVLIASGALDFAATLSVGVLVIGLAVAAPLLGHSGTRQGLVRLLAMLVGLAQLGALVALGGYAPTTWGLYVLIAIAGQWLAWREPGFAMVPRLSAGLAAVLLFLWPEPAPTLYLIVALAMLAVHVLPLHIRLWRPHGLLAATDLSAIAIATFLLPWLKFAVLLHGFEPHIGDATLAWIALGAAAISGIGLITGWRSAERLGDIRYVQLAGVTAALVAVAGMFGLAGWTIPLTFALLSAVLLFGGERAGDARFGPVALAFALAGVLSLTMSGGYVESEWLRLVGSGAGHPDGLALLRWSAVAVALALLAWRLSRMELAALAQIIAALTAYGALAQLMPRGLLLFAPGVAVLALGFATRRAAWPRLAPAIGVMLVLLVGWGLEPLARWLMTALGSLAGIPLQVDGDLPSPVMLVQQLLIPALLLGGSARVLAGRAQAGLIAGLAGIAAVLGFVALHGLYRHGFAAQAGTDFIATGIAQRVLWQSLLIGMAAAVARFAADAAWRKPAVTALAGAAFAHAIFYGLVQLNPLWAEQAVGALPLANWLVAIHGVSALAAWLLLREHPAVARAVDPVVQVGAMLLVAMLAFSTLRQAFSGSLLMAVPVGQLEDVLRSVLAILLAIGFLLWGARAGRRDWRIASLVLMLGAVAKVFLADAAGLEGLLRIASFVALGFSLIGIGWFYSKQLRSGTVAEEQPGSG